MSGPARPSFKSALVALQYPDFKKFFYSALISSSGTWLQAVAGPYVVFLLTDSPAWVGFAAFVQTIPMALVGPFAGALADRYPRRRILVVTQIVMSLIAITVAVVWWSGVREVLVYIGFAFLSGTISGFNMPAWQAFVADLVPRDALMNAITLNSTQFNAARLFGPAMAGLILAFAGPGWCYFGNGISYAVIIGTLLSLPDKTPTEPDGGREPPLAAFRSALRYARARRHILGPYFTAGVLAVFGATLANVHLVVFAERVFNVSEAWFGVLVAALGTGSMIAAPWVASVGPRIPRSRLLVVGMITYGLGELILASTTFFPIGVIGVMVAGASHITVATTTNSTLQMLVDESMRGRVMAIYLMILTAGLPIGGLVEGFLLSRINPRFVMTGMGLSLIAGAVILRVSGLAKDADQATLPRSGI